MGKKLFLLAITRKEYYLCTHYNNERRKQDGKAYS